MTELKTTSDVPDVSSAGINTSAKMVWQAVQATESFRRYSTTGRLQGLPGRYWQGSANQVINDLWPALSDRYLTEKEQAEDLKLALNRFLRVNRAMICTRDGGLVKKSMWFVAEHWPELTVTPGPSHGAKSVDESADVVTDEAATATPQKTTATPLDVFSLKRPALPAATTEEMSEEAMTTSTQEPVTSSPSHDDRDALHECRRDGCGERFEGVHHRATHEMRHGFRYNEDGTVTTFDPNDPVPDEEAVQDLIIRVCRDVEPMNTAQIVEAVRTLVPKASSSTVKIVLQILADDRWFEIISKAEGQRGRVRKFHFLGEPTRASRKKATQVVDEKSDSPAVETGFLSTAVATLRGDDDVHRVERYRDLFQDLMADLANLNGIREELAREKTLRLGAERNLELVTRERDELQGKLDTLKQVFGTALQ